MHDERLNCIFYFNILELCTLELYYNILKNHLNSFSNLI